MAWFAVAVFIMHGFLSACTTTSSIPAAEPSGVVIDDSSDDAHPMITEQAYVHDHRLYITFQHLSETVNSYALLPDQNETTQPGSSFNLTLQQAVAQHNGHPLAQLTQISQQELAEHTHDLEALPVAGIAMWREFRDRLISRHTPREKGSGIVIEFLKQEELFFYYDDQGLLKSASVNEKPAELKIADTYKFSELLSDATSLLGEYIPAVNGTDDSEILFNTGDNSAYGYPFIYANQATGQVIFLRRPLEDDDCCDLPGKMLPHAMVHTTDSHVTGLLKQPVGSIARLFSLVTFKVVDTVTPKPLVLLSHEPIPPISDHEPMDPEKWEQELNDLAYSPQSQGTIEYLVDGAAFFSRMIDTIHSAKESIDIRVYIFDTDHYALQIADLLKQRSKEIRVRVLVDGLGSITAAAVDSPYQSGEYKKPPSIIKYLKEDSEIEVHMAHNPWLMGDHTKTILIDNRIAYVGGMNLGREYRYDWHDLMVELHGPIVDEIQKQFEKAWRLQSYLGDIRAALYRPGEPVNQPQPNDIPIRLLFTRPGDAQILRAQLAAISRAKQRIFIQNAYFTSDDIIFELAQARRRGVDVRVIIPYQSDSGVINRSNVKAMNAMLDNGIRVYVYPGESHIKGAVYDGWVCLGSANFDQLSLRVNKELNIATSDPEAVQGFLDEVMYPDFKKSVELKEPLPEKWSDFLMETLADQL